jgi:alpha-galactosidase
MNPLKFTSPEGQETVLSSDGKTAWISRLHGLPCGNPEGKEAESFASGWIALRTAETESLVLEPFDSEPTHDGFKVLLRSADGAISAVSDWRLNKPTGVWSRRDVLTNTGNRPVVIHRALSRLAFAPAEYRLYSQAGGWCAENRGVWTPITHGTIHLGSRGGRTAENDTPYCCLLNSQSGKAVAIHVVPRGDWAIKVSTGFSWSGPGFYAVVDAGYSDTAMSLKLPPGESFILPEVLLQSVAGDNPSSASASLHNYANARWFSRGKPFAPVIFNTWFDQYDDLIPERLDSQLAAAKSAGCEVFVIDAGWFGNGPNWWNRVGNWTPRSDGPFAGQLSAFRERVRASGLKFGLWMEPERVHQDAPLVKEHPEWLVFSCRDSYRLNILIPEARKWLADTISRVVTEYELAWMKVDFNFELGPDPEMAALSGHFRVWHEMWDELRAMHPGCFFEGCAGGGGRVELGTMAAFDGHFLSDNITPTDAVRILQGAALRVPPGRITMWPVVRHYPGKGLFAAKRHGFEEPIPSNIDFLCRICEIGMFGLSGDLASLPPETLSRLKFHVDWYKANRASIVRSSARLLTPPLPVPNDSGWVGIQTDDQTGKIHRLLAFRFNDPESARVFRMEGLEAGKAYRLTTQDGVNLGEKSGRELMDQGITVALPAPMTADIISLTAATG